MDAKENELVVISNIPANSGHPLHKGTPREAFIREFLESHLPSTISIGTGEIIDANSSPGEARNQYDIILYRKNYPKLDFGGGISGFLIESVIATIEVKSTLTKEDLKQAMKAASAAKSLVPNVTESFRAGYVPPKVLNYVIAYHGPASMSTVLNWIPELQASLGIVPEALPKDGNERINTPSKSIDGIFVLNKGFIYFDNVPLGFATDEIRAAHDDLRWVVAETPKGNLLLFFLLLQNAAANIEGRWLNAVPYLSNFSVPKLEFGRA
ncbi:DUF6602 domain-containing protein [Thiocapsa sp.]|uniref:DUF6602 domain-containing protein n=1 Tax=Thiocapsa sp. TaxID=2024551 RepID=UPI0035947BC3